MEVERGTHDSALKPSSASHRGLKVSVADLVDLGDARVDLDALKLPAEDRQAAEGPPKPIALMPCVPANLRRGIVGPMVDPRSTRRVLSD